MIQLHHTNPLLTLAVVLTAGLVGSIFARKIRLPGITGQILVGVLLGPSVLHFLDIESVEQLTPVTHFALGLIAVTVGNHLNIRRLRNMGKRLLLLVLIEATVIPALVFGGLLLVPGTPIPLALLLAAISIATAPATVIALVSETRSKGIFVRTLIAAVALNNIACIVAFEIARVVGRVILQPSSGGPTLALLAAPLRQVGASIALGVGVGVILVAATWRMVRPDRLATASILAILVAAGLADLLGLPALLCCLFLGLTLANLTPERDEIGHRVFVNFESAILTVFFTLAGMELNLKHAATAGVLAALVFSLRVAGKVTAAGLAMKLADATRSVRRYLGIALVPQAGLAIGLIVILQDDPVFAPVQALFLTVGITVVMMNEIVGPILTRTALARSGEVGLNRPRLIDFLREDNIVTDFHADTLEEAIARLTDILIVSNHLKVDRDRLLESILEREMEVSTCIGDGLAVPHGILSEGSAIVGAMGISHKGMHFPTPDGKPLHCMVVLATPPDRRERHLEILAAFARAIGGDREVHQQLYNAKTPAHAYELLHAEDAGDFNYFLDQEG